MNNADRYLWLEEVEGEKALDWVKKQNKLTQNILENDTDYNKYYETVKKILSSGDRIPYGKILGNYVYNFWQDEKHMRGLWRRTSLAEYKKDNPVWDILIDFDKLAEKENENWVFGGSIFLPSDFSRCFITLSRGGKDARVFREYDVEKREFVENGFKLEEARNDVCWLDKDTILVSADFGPDSMTEAKCPRTVRRWKRGEPLDKAAFIAECEKKHVQVSMHKDFRTGMVFIGKFISTNEQETYILDNEDNLRKIDIPVDSDFRRVIFKGRLILQLRSDWKIGETVFLSGGLVSIDLKHAFKVDTPDKVEEILVPHKRMYISGIFDTESSLLISVMENVSDKIYQYRLENGKWIRKEVDLPPNGSLSILYTEDPDLKYALINYSNFLTPPSLYLMEVNTLKMEKIKSLKPAFNSDDLIVKQGEGTSKDGMKIPYYIIHKKDIENNGKNRVLQYGYGAHGISLTPSYMSVTGKLWLENGGVFVQANIRGGGEFGPKWHQAGIKHNCQRAFDDFISVSEDLIKKKVTSPEYLGITGASAGGLLMGVMLTQRPDLYNAICCSVPVLDMIRYSKLLVGHAWIGESGDPDIEEDYKYLIKYSPYHNLKKDIKYPEIFFITSTKDDRVHPAHARKMAAKMIDEGHKIFYFENDEGGHNGSANLIQRAKITAMKFIYLKRKLRSS